MAGQLWEWATTSDDDKARAQFAKLTLDILGYAKHSPVPPSAPTNDKPGPTELPALEI